MDIIMPPQWSPSLLQDESLDNMFNFIYGDQDGTTDDELVGSDRSGLLSQLLQTVFGDTTVLGQVEIEEMIQDGVDVTDDRLVEIENQK